MKAAQPRTKERIESDISLWNSIRVASRDGGQRARAAKRLEALEAELKDHVSLLTQEGRG